MPPNLGSFGQGQPGGAPQDALQEAISARQTGGQPVPQLNQTMQGSPQPGQAPQTAVGSSPQPKPPLSESELIIKAMDQRLRAISEVEKGGAGVGSGAMGGGNPMMKTMTELMSNKQYAR